MDSKKIKKTVVQVLTLVIGIVTLYALSFGAIPEMSRRVLFWTFIAVVLFIRKPTDVKKYGKIAIAWDALCIAATLASGFHIYSNWMKIARQAGATTPVDTVFAAIGVFIALEATRRTVGWILVSIPAALMAYALFGSGLPGIFAHRGYSFSRMVTYLYKTTEGIYGIPMSTAATYVVVFVTFGAFLDQFGVGKIFVDFAYRVTGRMVGGPAKASVVSSALLGTISGSSTGNVVADGVFTIPLMKKCGYQAEFAGAVEAAASCGGMIMPPVMGAAAFLMAEMTGIPYSTIALSAAIPAILYFLGIFVTVDLRARRLKLGRASEYMQVDKFDPKTWYLIVPLVVLVYRLISGISGPKAAIEAIYATVIVAAIFSGKGPVSTVKAALSSLSLGVERTVSVAGACASAGLIVGLISLTGLGSKITDIVMMVSKENLFLTMLLSAIVSLVLSMGLPTTAVYVIVAVLLAPTLIHLGVPVLAAHLFIFYWGMLSSLTPPVALGAYAAAGIAGSDPNRTAWAGFKLALAGFIIPFAWVYSPGLLGMGTPLAVALSSVTGVVGVFLLASSTEGYLIGQCSWWGRMLLGVSAVILIVFNGWQLLIAAAFVAVVLVDQLRKRRASGSAPSAA